MRLDSLGRGHSVSLSLTTVRGCGRRVGDAVISSIFLMELAGEPMIVRAFELMFMVTCGGRLIAVDIVFKGVTTVVENKNSETTCWLVARLAGFFCWGFLVEYGAQLVSFLGMCWAIDAADACEGVEEDSQSRADAVYSIAGGVRGRCWY